ncbi:lysine--tRNA ligase [archaeon]|nr:lysine--tRNA ligase [archaeon]
MHWSDSYAKKIVEKKPDKKEYIVESGITPSGVVHAGNFREVMTQEFVYKALLKLGVKAKYQYVWDDYDRLRKIPANVPENWKKEGEQYIGMPVSEVPDPWGTDESYSKHFANKLIEESEKCGVHADYVWMSEEYKKCTFSENMRVALEKKEQIRELLNQFRREPHPKEWMPVRVYCETCHKDTTKVEYASEYKLHYQCECGASGEFDFRKKGFAKLKWRICWPSRWAFYDVDFESSGKDHKASGGSWDTGERICQHVFEHAPPIGPMYEFIYAKGQKEKMSSSKGNVFTVSDLLEVYEPEMVRYIYTPKINRAIEVPFDEGIFNYYESYDLAERVFFGKEEVSNDREKENFVTSYELSQNEKPKQTLQPQFSFLADVAQIAPNLDKAIAVLQRTGHAPEKLSETDKARIVLRLELAGNWAKKYAPENRKLIIVEDVPELSEAQKKALAKLPEAIKKSTNPEELGAEIKTIIGESGLNPKDFFQGAYMTLLGKDRGPRLAPFLLTLDEQVVEKKFSKL